MTYIYDESPLGVKQVLQAAERLIERVCEKETPYAQEILRRFVTCYGPSAA